MEENPHLSEVKEVYFLRLKMGFSVWMLLNYAFTFSVFLMDFFFLLSFEMWMKKPPVMNVNLC